MSRRKRNILHTLQRRYPNRTGDTFHNITLIKQVTQGKKEGKRREEEDVSNYWLTLRKREDTVV
jgi:hypothetical protein